MRKYPELSSIKTGELDIGLSPGVKNTFVKSQRPVSLGYGHFFYGGQKSKRASQGITGNRQNCTVKASYRETAEQHLKNLEYIQKEGKSTDGDRPVLFGSCTEEEYKKDLVPKNWRLIVSPESNKINLTVLATELMRKIEEGTGYRLSWIAANHFDTDNHHTHILINGIDRNGRDVDLFSSKGFGSQIIREYARDICTSLIGYRSKGQIFENMASSVNKPYYTRLDKIIACNVRESALEGRYLASRYEILLQKRLEYLQKIGLARYDSRTHKFIFREDWEGRLRLIGRYNTYYDGFNSAGCPPDKYYLHEVKKAGMVKGTIISKYTMQKDSNNYALVIKKEDGTVAYVPLPFYPRNCFVGDRVKIENINNKIKLNRYKK